MLPVLGTIKTITTLTFQILTFLCYTMEVQHQTLNPRNDHHSTSPHNMFYLFHNMDLNLFPAWSVIPLSVTAVMLQFFLQGSRNWQ